jgi:hypothetical protein
LLSKSRVNAATAYLTLSASFGKVVANGGSTLHPWCTPKRKIKDSKFRRTRWPSDRPAPGNLFLWKLATKEVRHLLVEMWRRSVFLEQHVIGNLFFQNRHEEFLYLRRDFNNCECSASGGKIWKFKRHYL